MYERGTSFSITQLCFQCYFRPRKVKLRLRYITIARITVALLHLLNKFLISFQIQLYEAREMTVGGRKNETPYDFDYFFNKRQ